MRPLNLEENKIPPSVEYTLNSKYTLIIDGNIRLVLNIEWGGLSDDHFLIYWLLVDDHYHIRIMGGIHLGKGASHKLVNL